MHLPVLFEFVIPFIRTSVLVNQAWFPTKLMKYSPEQQFHDDAGNSL